MPLAIPKLEPELVRLHEAAARVLEREPSLDISQVRKTLSDAIAYGRLPVQSDDNLNDALTWTAYRARQQGFIGSTFAETWSRWLETGAEIGWDAGMIFVSMAGHVVPIHLPRVRLVDVFALFEATTEETPTLQERTSEETAQAVAAAGKPPAPQPQPSAEIEKKINDWYTDRVKLRSLQVRAGIPGEP